MLLKIFNFLNVPRVLGSLVGKSRVEVKDWDNKQGIGGKGSFPVECLNSSQRKWAFQHSPFCQESH